MKPETKQCQNCKKDFVIESDDFGFYEKIKVPPPTFCPKCRAQRRMSWRNVRNLYKTSCDAPDHNEYIISVYSEDKNLMVYDQKFWWGDNWDPISYGREYDFSTPFFIQFSNLLKEVPLPNISNVNSINTEYGNMTIGSKNCYLIFASNNNENCHYSEGVYHCNNSLDVLSSRNSEYIYESIDCENCYNVIFCFDSTNCIDSYFLYNCRNCTNCLGCWNLRNKKYHIFNREYSKDDYFKMIEEYKLNSFSNLSEFSCLYKSKLKNVIRKYSNIINSKNVTGNMINSSYDCHNSFEISKVENSKFVWRFLDQGGSNNYDITGGTKPELCYEGNGMGAGYNIKFGIATGNTMNSHYIFSCMTNSSNLFGCVSLNSKQYCILNKQYTKEQYEELLPKIIKHMSDMPYIDAKGRVYKYGEFFPPELSPFCYNETIAQEYFPLTKEEAIKQGYKWKDKEVRNYIIDIKNEDIPNDIKDVTDNIIGKVIECAHKDCNHQCTEAFKIIPEELSFYKRMNLPLPRLCPNCRHYARLQQRNPLKLWHRKCMHEGCNNEFETSYAPERPEIVYCESCYNKEVY